MRSECEWGNKVSDIEMSVSRGGEVKKGVQQGQC